MSPLVKKILATLGALAMLAYVGYQLYMYLRPPMKTETITHVTAYETLETKGVVFRDETVLSTAPNGHLFYTVQNGGRIARGGKIAEIYTSQNDALVQQELNALDEEIKQLQVSRKELEEQYTDLKTARTLSLYDKDIKDTKQRLTSLVREIDRCIALLNE